MSHSTRNPELFTDPPCDGKGMVIDLSLGTPFTNLCRGCARCDWRDWQGEYEQRMADMELRRLEDYTDADQA